MDFVVLLMQYKFLNHCKYFLFANTFNYWNSLAHTNVFSKNSSKLEVGIDYNYDYDYEYNEEDYLEFYNEHFNTISEYEYSNNESEITYNQTTVSIESTSEGIING